MRALRKNSLQVIDVPCADGERNHSAHHVHAKKQSMREYCKLEIFAALSPTHNARLGSKPQRGFIRFGETQRPHLTDCTYNNSGLMAQEKEGTDPCAEFAHSVAPPWM